MQKIKQRLQQWMEHYNFADLDNEAFAKRLKRSERKIFKKASLSLLLDWIECEDGIERRRHYEQRIKNYEKEPADMRIEYRITSMGLRKRGEKVVAPAENAQGADARAVQYASSSIAENSSSSSSSAVSSTAQPSQRKRNRIS
jgi:hypothetical protein